MKKWMRLLPVLCLFLLVGCGGKTDPDAGQSQVPDGGEEVSYTLSVEAFYHGEDLRMFRISEEWDGETTQTEYNNLSFMAVPGETLAALMTDMGYADFELVDDGGTFVGWMKYTIHEGEDGFWIWSRADDVLYTTEEIMSIAVEDISLSFVAKWSDIDDAYYAENGY